MTSMSRFRCCAEAIGLAYLDGSSCLDRHMQLIKHFHAGAAALAQQPIDVGFANWFLWELMT